jgi:signal transduction histidine kinase/ketosteroid isomerase-like protein
MKPTEKQKADVLNVYDIWLSAYLNGDVKTYDFYFDDEYRFIGSTDNEDFLNRTDTTKFFAATADQLAGKVEIRNSKKTLEKFDEIILITDLFDAYFLDGNDWAYYGKFRFTSALKKNEDDWRIVYQHFSTPDSKAQEGETIGTEQIAAENIQLREAVQRRTVELEHKTRELEIEAALDRVRSRSMAMNHSNELQEIITVVFIQMQQLGIKADASLINILTEESKDFYMWIGTKGQNYAQKIRIPYIKHPVFDVFYEARDRGENFLTNALTREEKDSFFEYAFEHSDLKLMPDERKKYVMDSAGFARTFAWSKNSGITVQNYAGIPYSDEENDILKRFAREFEQAYTRFLDVKNAEAQAKEAERRAALDRVRGEIASMRTKEDLNLITPLMWKELNTLGVPFFRCGVLIMDENKNIINTYLSKPNGDSLSAFEMSFDAKEIAVGAVKHWKLNEIYYEHWDKNQFVSFMQSLINTGQVESPETYQGSYAPPESLYLHLVPFKQGMLYVGNTNPLKPEELQLVKALSETFSVAYSRYEDFKNIEEAKNQIEKTLSELKATQSQLIHAEKMASLGELTAGIAHEIQNPLNFVNNFSEISKELLDEMKEELASGNLQLASEISDDVIQNLEKILRHGKRADSIVKGMLQHSQTSKGQKELTDINALADEYLRLSYHGLRAKDKSFNSDFKTEFDESLPKINVIPQDIGRVLLNLINNAFYAVKAPLPPEGGIQESDTEYKPMIIVRTGSYLPPSGGMRGAFISVTDNGPGIEKNIIDKIFQPFFTTKPTGQGTGLGLSLSYDIVKAHGGELKVKSIEG